MCDCTSWIYILFNNNNINNNPLFVIFHKKDNHINILNRERGKEKIVENIITLKY